jgi:chromosomal replication initiator protein
MSNAWSKIKIILEKRLKSGIFQVWIKPLQGEVEDKTLFLTAPNDFVASWVKERLLETIQQAGEEVLGFKPELSLLTSKGSNGSNGQASPLTEGKGQKRLNLPLEQPRPSAQSISRWRYSFDEFIVGQCNQLAYAACTSLCNMEFPAGSIFLCSGPGLGKTHLLQAIGNHVCRERGTKSINVAYLSSEQFANQMVQALKSKTIDEFKRRYRESVDLLLLEDIHFFQGKEKMQEELLSLIKSLEASGRKVVFTSSFLPKELNKVDSQLTSYFCSGLLAPIEKPDFDLRVRLVEKKAKHFQIDIPEDVSRLVAGQIKSDIRQLESCIQNMALKALLLRQEVSSDLAREVLRNYTQQSQAPDIQEIIDFVCQTFNLPKPQLGSKSRKRQVVMARNTAFYLARKHTELSLKDIGKRFNRRHSTVLKGITNVEKEMSKDTSVGRQLTRIVERMDH